MRPSLGPVLPGVSAGVSGDERIRPVNLRALFVVAIERLVVILTLVTEEPAKLIDLVGPVRGGNGDAARIDSDATCRGFMSVPRAARKARGGRSTTCSPVALIVVSCFGLVHHRSSVAVPFTDTTSPAMTHKGAP